MDEKCAPELSEAESATVAKFGLDKPEVMPDGGYTPSMERVEDLFAWALVWDSGKHEDRPDLAKLQVDQRAEFRRALAAHDAAIRKTAIKDAVDWARSCSGESADVAAEYIEEMAGQSFTGTEKK